MFPVWGSGYRFDSSCISSPENHILLLCLCFPLSPSLSSFFLLINLPFFITLFITLYHFISLSFCIFDIPHAYIWYTTLWCTVYFKCFCPNMKNQYYSFCLICPPKPFKCVIIKFSTFHTIPYTFFMFFFLL